MLMNDLQPLYQRFEPGGYRKLTVSLADRADSGQKQNGDRISDLQELTRKPRRWRGFLFCICSQKDSVTAIFTPAPPLSIMPNK